MEATAIGERIAAGTSRCEAGLELLRRFDVLDRLARIECPTLVCVGELDPIAPVDAAREIADALPGRVAQLAIVEDAGHFTWKDAPDRYWPLVTDFVTTTAGTKPPQVGSNPGVSGGSI